MEKLDWQTKSKIQFWIWIVNPNIINQIVLQSGLNNPAIPCVHEYVDYSINLCSQAISEETVLSGNQHSAEGSIASSCTVTSRCMTPSSPALTEKSTFSDIEMKTASSTSVPVLSPLPVAKSVSTRPKNNRKNKSGKNQGCNTTATSVNNNNGVSAVASSSCSGTGGCKPTQNLKTVEEAGSSPKLRNPGKCVAVNFLIVYILM